jgi:hypothetical protein
MELPAQRGILDRYSLELSRKRICNLCTYITNWLTLDSIQMQVHSSRSHFGNTLHILGQRVDLATKSVQAPSQATATEVAKIANKQMTAGSLCCDPSLEKKHW